MANIWIPEDMRTILVRSDLPIPDIVWVPDESVPKPSQLIEHDQRAGYSTQGCYLWIDGGWKGKGPTYLYAGKAAKMANRILAHWQGKNGWLSDYWDRVNNDFDLGGNLFSGCPEVYIWFTTQRAAMEPRMIAAFRPLFNKQRP